ncbi:phospholipase D-like domain-containing protein [Azohydromonas australica]|uniref:phospholipase D-like domain-containing protein n=1 Tax=Azohydromonas australica TaxID=364039 RepID=UPI0006882825|nr:phospholipase D-like domain-containing protein [Azohydromonas australica]
MSTRYITNNGTNADHLTLINRCFASAERFDCMIAFAKESGFSTIIEKLRKALERGITARCVIGLSFHQTEPSVLAQLLSLSSQHDLTLYISHPESSVTFHPKVYCFRGKTSSRIVIGSANLTNGGLRTNHESSIFIEDSAGSIAKEISSQIDRLISSNAIIEARQEELEAYKKKYRLFRVHHRIADAKARKALQSSTSPSSVLHEILREIKNDETDNGFDSQVERRLRSRNKARVRLARIRNLTGINARRFLEHYEQLTSGLWHSGGLHRGKNIVATKSRVFQMALQDLHGRKGLTPSEAYRLLHERFSGVNNAGVNVITEILHTIDNEKFAVMNQNSVAGMETAGYTGFPAKPTKRNVDAELYEQFCSSASAVRDSLGLGNFTELDTLFNYTYWN